MPHALAWDVPFTVLQCGQCRGRLAVVASSDLEWECPSCRLRLPVESCRWLAYQVAADEAARLAATWNERLRRGLSWSESVEFKRLVP
ncbi:MAG TPA: hypothetical protein VFH47_04485 [Candidatus Thermoplasmatota archaeon]|nr:hypothetical protein [Candidatus Thermoplasmatota archaeon]